MQQGSSVFVLDTSRASVDVLDATTSEVVETVPVPPGETTLALAGDRVVLAANGDFWSMPAADFVDFDAESDPLLTFGRGTVTSVDPEGVLFAFTPALGLLIAIILVFGAVLGLGWRRQGRQLVFSVVLGLLLVLPWTIELGLHPSRLGQEAGADPLPVIPSNPEMPEAYDLGDFLIHAQKPTENTVRPRSSSVAGTRSKKSA